jgi:hypothetical protein
MWHPDEPSQPSVPLADLTLRQLRAYRDTLRHEADRVSYWRRVAHGRIDLLTAQRHTGTALSGEQLARVLADTASGRNRAGLMTIAAAEPLPELPELDEIWSEHVDPADEAAAAGFLERLRTAERQLNAYRDALHGRVDETTAELIARYREDPRRALELLGEKEANAGG